LRAFHDKTRLNMFQVIETIKNFIVIKIKTAKKTLKEREKIKKSHSENFL